MMIIIITSNNQRLRSAGEGQNAFAPALCFAYFSRDRWSKHAWSDYEW